MFAFQLPFREFPGIQYNDFPLPFDAYDKAEFMFARLMYPEIGSAARFNSGRSRDDSEAWKHGKSIWTQDYPRADRHFLQAVRRLTRIHARSAEQPVDLDDGDDVYNWPWIYAVQPGAWELTNAQAARLRDATCCAAALSCATTSGAIPAGKSSKTA